MAGDDGSARGSDPQDGSATSPTPAWADLKTKAGKDRKRLPLACIACRRKKIRCSGEKPACKHCLKSRMPCVYKVTTRKATPRTDYMAMLDKRLKRMEERVIKIIPKDEADTIASVPRAVLKPPQPAKPSKDAKDQSKGIGQKRTADDYFREEFRSWIDGQPSGAHGARPSGSRPTSSNHQQGHSGPLKEDRLAHEGRDQLPSQELQEHLAEVYFDYLYGQSYCLLHKPTYMRRLHSGRIPPVLSLAVCAVSARFSQHPYLRTDPPFLRGQAWAKASQDIVLKEFEFPNITVVITLFLLSVHTLGTCQGGRSWMFGGMAIRMAYALQLHRDPIRESPAPGMEKPGELPFLEREIRRRVMWSIFAMDRFNASGTERPMFALEEHMSLQLPVKEEFFMMELPARTEGLRGPLAAQDGSTPPDEVARSNMGVGAYNLRLVALWGRAIGYLNFGGRMRDEYPLWHSKSVWHRLLTQLNDFVASLPHDLHWSSVNIETHAKQNIANQFFYLHIMINQVTLLLHRFAFPAISIYEPVKGMPPDFLSLARQKCLSCAAEISHVIECSEDYRFVVPIAGYSAYMSSAVHVYGCFARNEKIEAASAKNLTINMNYLNKMKKYWGMFNFLTQNLRDMYHQHLEASRQGRQPPDPQNEGQRVFQYADWHERYPQGVSRTDYEEPAANSDATGDSLFSQEKELQSVEDFFASLSPSAIPDNSIRMAKRSRREYSGVADTSTSQHDNAVREQSMPTRPASSLNFDMNSFAFNNDSGMMPARSAQPQAMLDAIAASGQFAPGMPPGLVGAFGNPMMANNPSAFPSPTSQNPYSGQAGSNGIPGFYPNMNTFTSAAGAQPAETWPMDFAREMNSEDYLINQQNGAWFMPYDINMTALAGAPEPGMALGSSGISTAMADDPNAMQLHSTTNDPFVGASETVSEAAVDANDGD